MILPQDWVGGIFAVVLGSIIGSFLGACIYRLPRGISLGKPARSFCPECKTTIRWYRNIPLISYLMLRGRCPDCKTRIPVRYFLVEALTAILFLSVWMVHSLPLSPLYWILVSLLIAATFIDIDHLIIPDEITLGGIGAGILLSLAFPMLMGTGNRWDSLLQSLLGAGCGFLTLWAVVEGGKLAFGKKKMHFKQPRPFVWRRKGDTAEVDFGDEKWSWDELFSRESDELTVLCDSGEIPGRGPVPEKLIFRYNTARLPDGDLDLDTIDEIRGVARGVIAPREAMGFGDVKFLAAIGAFLGWQAVLFTIFASSIIGCIVGVAKIIASRGRPSEVIPFGPFLAIGALLWILGGSAWWVWYFGRFHWNPL